MARRTRLEIYVDTLRSLHSIKKTKDRPTIYRLERLTGVPHTRLKSVLRHLMSHGLVDEKRGLTPKGYQFLQDVTKNVIWVLR